MMVLHAVNALNYFTLVCNEISHFLEVVSFTMVKTEISSSVNLLEGSSIF